MRWFKQELRPLGEFDRFLEWSTRQTLDWAGGNYCRVSAGLGSLEVGGAPEPGVVHQSILLTAWGRTRARSQQWLSDGGVGKFRLLKFGCRAGGQLCGTVHTALSLRRTF